MGSGKRLKSAIKKYGKENFHKEILYICADEKEMNLREKILVVPDTETNYNLSKGGYGGFLYTNEIYWTKDKRLEHNRKYSPYGTKQHTEKLKNNGVYKKAGVASRKWFESLSKEDKKRLFSNSSFLGRKHTKETKDKISKGAEKRLGNKNGSFGTCWITNNLVNKKIKKDELDNWLELGYHKGRI